MPVDRFLTMALTRAEGGNRLLAALDPDDHREIARHIEYVDLPRGRVLYETEDEITHVYFPSDCVISLVSAMEDGRVAETATIGREGMVGFIAALGRRHSLNRNMVQIPGTAARIQLERVCDVFQARPEFRQLLLCYAEALLAQALQSVACNALHAVEARFCRWMLTAQDRAAGDRIPLTHEYLADMLGVQRTTVTLVAGALQTAGFISYRRGTVMVLDRAGLEKTSCECYGLVRRQFERLLPLTYS